MITLYDYELSGDCYKVRLLLGWLDIPHVLRPIDFYPGREHESAGFRVLSPLGQLPVLQDAGLVLREAEAILVYLASRYDASGAWYPRDTPERLGSVTMWLMFAAGLSGSVGKARLHDAMFHDGDVEGCREQAALRLRILDEQLWFSERTAAGWVCDGERPTIADVACFPYAMLCEEAGVVQSEYPALRRWGDRLRQLPRFRPMPGIFAAPAP